MSQLQFLELPKGAVLPITKINPGLWYWKDDTKTLEFASAYPKEEPKEKFKKGKTIHFQESGSKTLDRSTPSYFRDIFALRNSIRGAEDKSPRPVKRGQNELITLDDVKFAALFLADEDETFHVPSFSIVMRCKQLDGFLMALLYYISFFLEKIALENKPKSFMGRKISTSQKDRDFFECLYNFSSYVAFVTFKQKNLKEIQQEVGRLLRSNIFNPALRDRTTRKEVIKTDITKEAKKVKFPYCRSADARQPAIRSVMDQRSPVLSTLLPMAKDSAQYLFQNHYLRPGKTSPSYDPEDLPELSSVVTQNKIGIIGTPRSKYNPHTLIPLGIQDEMEEDNESLRTKTSMSSICSRELTASSQRGTQDSGSHTCVAVSRATTEGDYVENPQ
ncbi:protein phosphatase 1 regulatory subunit 36 isoform X2 [Hemicordylus capensis]|uniref:protein phosphatase 1 regulatory subunit 36 isoform X2 n=1 Tax=Hemicordylus capensis TaxID=884348 RepID=UPI002304C441|nr:protein phosphatase 1 regulatory subunit 36 isoform X2 [Hemicordylus capensis]